MIFDNWKLQTFTPTDHQTTTTPSLPPTFIIDFSTIIRYLFSLHHLCHLSVVIAFANVYLFSLKSYVIALFLVEFHTSVPSQWFCFVKHMLHIMFGCLENARNLSVWSSSFYHSICSCCWNWLCWLCWFWRAQIDFNVIWFFVGMTIRG